MTVVDEAGVAFVRLVSTVQRQRSLFIDQESSGMQMTSARVIHLAPLFVQHGLSDRTLLVPERDQTSLPESSDRTVEPTTISKNKSDRKSAAYATTKLAINIAKEPSDAGFPPLKSLAGVLLAILSHCELSVSRFSSWTLATCSNQGNRRSDHSHLGPVVRYRWEKWSWSRDEEETFTTDDGSVGM